MYIPVICTTVAVLFDGEFIIYVPVNGLIKWHLGQDPKIVPGLGD